MPGKLNLVSGIPYDVTYHNSNVLTPYQGQFTDNTHGSGGPNNWTASPLT